MGILDELRDETERKKFVEQGEAISAEKTTENYKKNILPKMQLIFDFFKEIVEHLQFLKNPIMVTNYSSKYPDLGDLTQQDYKLSTDKFGGISHYHELMDVNIKFYCTGEEPLEFDVKTQAEIDQQVNFLNSKNIPYEWSRHHNNVKQSFASFIVQKKIPVKISFTVDYNNSIINLEILNHHDFGHISRSYSPSEINNDLLDQLAKFLLRKENTFITEEMNEEERNALRENLRKNINFGNSEYESSSVKVEDKENRGIFGKIGSFLSQKN